MRRLVYFIACTADGFIARQDGTFDFFPMTGEHYPFIAAEYPETIPAHGREALGATGENRRFDTVLMGRATYEVGAKLGISSPYPHLRQFVVSRSMGSGAGGAAPRVSGDAVELVRQLKGEGGLDIWLCGGAELAGALYAEIDEVVLKVNPVVLGAGLPLFRGAHGVRALELMEHRVFGGGVAIHRYRASK